MTDVKTDAVQRNGGVGRLPDAFDRKILGALIENADISYADLGALVGLSAPAVHDRVKKLRASGCLRGTSAIVDGPIIGKPLIAFVRVDITGWCGTPEMIALSDLPEVEEIHSVTGDASLLLKVRCASGPALQSLLARIYACPGVRGTRSDVVLSTSLERPVQAGVTDFDARPDQPRAAS